ncbi:helix-turn-helix domain-containing protein [[Clostridium] fimetarium]|uniref:Helix-turn-helix n=1 Tax=[Clostridium] fimetarium TaxID=99656 RepID=A0A1I0RDU6_9FIRM|nr:helix-turn-helix transcriptional regulator [[Clostridium] fimetarium]SEW38968.1 Helix-turn-helix [[Clostridium] fimetarium]
MSENTNRVLLRMQELLAERDWSIYKLAKESDIPYSSVNNIFIRNTCPTIVSLEKICKGFDVTLSEFFSYDTPIKQRTDLSTKERKIIHKYRELPRNDKKILEAYLDGLLKK